uniref:Uncharacterized protein n=1 Tax=Palpitomonas bilix TaxID=652834 RepID=A0A7S3DHU5_9EUKA
MIICFAYGVRKSNLRFKLLPLLHHGKGGEGESKGSEMGGSESESESESERLGKKSAKIDGEYSGNGKDGKKRKVQISTSNLEKMERNEPTSDYSLLSTPRH